MKFTKWIRDGKWFVLPAAFVLTVGMTAIAAEHPSEHPAEKSEEHEHSSEHPAGKAEAKVTKETLAKAIKEYVEKDAALKGGYYLVYDKKDKKPLALKLEKVHEDRLSKVSNGVYFACADFKTPEKVLYDLDIFMKDGARGLEVTEVTVHKKQGKARYNWTEEKGVWKRKEVK